MIFTLLYNNQNLSKKLTNFLKVSLSKKQSKIKINIVESKTHIKLKDIKKILESIRYKTQFSVLEHTHISGNYIILSKSTQMKKSYSKFSKKVMGYLDIIDDSTMSDNYKQFEIDVGEIFKSLGFNVEQLGAKKIGTEVTDVIIKSEQAGDPGGYWACLIDAKARVNGFEIESTSRRAMKEYLEQYQETVGGKNPFPSKALMFVSSKFNGNVENKLEQLRKKSKVNCCCISAENLLLLLDLHLTKSFSHEKLLGLLSSNKEISSSMIYQIY